MRFARILLVLLALAVLIPLGALIALVSLDRGVIRAELERRIEAVLERDVTIEGPVTIGLSLRPTLEVGGLAVANAAWGSRPQMLKVRQVALKLAILPLLSRRIEIDRIELEGLDLLLERDGAGHGNWDVAGSGAGEGAGAAAAPSAGPAAEPARPAPAVSIRTVEVRSATVTLRDGSDARVWQVELTELSAEAAEPGAPIELEAMGTVDGREIGVKGTLPALPLLLSGGEGPARVDIEALGVRLLFDGMVTPAAPPRLDGTLAIVTDDLAAFGRELAVELPAGRLEARTRLGLENATLRASDLAIEGPLGDLAGDLVLDLGAARPKLTGDLAAQTLDLRPLQGEEEKGAEKGETGDDADRGARRDKRVIPQIAIPRPPPGIIDVQLGLQADRLLARDIEATDVVTTLGIDDRGLRLASLQATLFSTPMSGSLDLGLAQGGEPRLALRLDARSLDAGAVLAGFGYPGLLEARGPISLELEGEGAASRDLLARLRGRVRLFLGPGRVQAGSLDRLVGGVRAALETASALFGRRDGTVPLRCMTAMLVIDQGVAVPELFVVDTEVSTVSAKGRIDLGRERLDLVLTPRARSATLNLALPVTLTGSFAEPRVGVDAAGAARILGGLVGAFAFPPAALGALADLGSGATDCVQAAETPGTAADGALQGTVDTGRKALEDAGRLLRGLLGR